MKHKALATAKRWLCVTSLKVKLVTYLTPIRVKSNMLVKIYLRFLIWLITFVEIIKFTGLH